MSTSASFENVTEFEESIASVRSDMSSDAFVIVGHIQNDPLRLHVLKVGQDVQEIGQYMDSTQVMYILARYETTFDMSTTVKFVYFRWLGEEVSKKGKFGVVRGSIQDYFNPYHLFLETSSTDDFETSHILQQLQENSGKKSNVIDSSAGHQMRGFTASQLPKRGPAPKTGPQISSDGAAVDVTDEVLEAIEQVQSDDSPTRWLVAEYSDGHPKGPIILTATGEGDSYELADALRDDAPMYGLYRTTDVVDDITTVKFVYIKWVGANVKPMTKAKISTHKGTAESTFGPFHVAIYATDLSELSEKDITEKVTSASGSKSHVK